MIRGKKVLIVIPTKNSEKYLKSVIRSCLNQSYKNFEILIVDNNSDDNTLKIAAKYIKLLIRVLREVIKRIMEQIIQMMQIMCCFLIQTHIRRKSYRGVHYFRKNKLDMTPFEDILEHLYGQK